MLKPITTWDDMIELRSVLAERGEEIFLCQDCKHPWLGSADNPPERCPNTDCRALADSPKRDRPGRPVLS